MPAKSRDHLRLVCLLLALVTLVVYLPVRHHEFVLYDDPQYVSENWHVQSGLTWAGIRWAFTTWHFSNWHPLTWLSHMLDCQLFGVNPGPQHVVNVLFHIANTVLLFLLLQRWTQALWPSALVAALFAWHPLHVESVAWISSRKDVLSTFFGLLALAGYGRYARAGQPRYLWLAALGLGVGLMAKPMLVTLPCVMVLLDVWPFGRLRGSHPVLPSANSTQQKSLGCLILEKWPLFLLAAASSVVTYAAQRSEAVVSVEALPLRLRVANAIVAYVRYVVKTFWPTELSVIYPLPNHFSPSLTVLALLGLIVITLLVWRMRQLRPYVMVGWFLFLGSLVPVIGLIQVGGQAMADRYTYFPLVGLFIALAWSTRDWLGRSRSRAVLVALALGLCLILTSRQLEHWQNSQTLFRRAIAVTRNNAIAHINLGLALEQAGQPEEALAQVREALRLAPNRPQAHNNLANLLSAMGRTEEAIASYQRALELKADAPLVHMNLGSELAVMNRFEEAMQHYTNAARITTDDPLPHYLMGTTRQREGNIQAAIDHFRHALRLDPDNPKALTRLARLLATDPDARWRDGAEAVRLAERANALLGGQEPFVLDTLAMAYAEAGGFAQAVQTAQRASELVAAAGDTQAVAIIQGRLQNYLASQPYRESPTNSALVGRQR